MTEINFTPFYLVIGLIIDLRFTPYIKTKPVFFCRACGIVNVIYGIAGLLFVHYELIDGTSTPYLVLGGGIIFLILSLFKKTLEGSNKINSKAE